MRGWPGWWRGPNCGWESRWSWTGGCCLTTALPASWNCGPTDAGRRADPDAGAAAGQRPAGAACALALHAGRLAAGGAGQGPVAQVCFLPEPTGRALLHVAVAPSAPPPGQARGAPGRWRIALTTGLNTPVRVIARVQRDDTPLGHAPFGRQSWLDHPEGWAWDTDRRDYSRPQPQSDGTPPCPITREGSYVAFGGTDREEIWLIGAARPDRVAGGWTPSAFSAEGAQYLLRPGESAGPDLVAAGEAGGFTGGIAASGCCRAAGCGWPAPRWRRRRWRGGCWSISAWSRPMTAALRPSGRRWWGRPAGPPRRTGAWAMAS